MVAYIDEFKDRFRGGPICRVLAASLDCGFITPRGYRMFVCVQLIVAGLVTMIFRV